MKILITSDTHQDGAAILRAVKYARDHQIDTVVDCGDLHGDIDSFRGIKLHSVYWDKAISGMPRRDFFREVSAIGGTVHENGTTFKLEDMLAFIQHDLAEREDEIPEKRLAHANEMLDEAAEAINAKDLKRFIFFGHTHNPHFNDDGKSIAINPGATGLGEGCFAVLDLGNNTLEYRNEKSSLTSVQIGGDVIQMREIRPRSHIERLRTGNEVFVYHKQEQEKRTEEFAQILSALNSFDGGLTMQVVNAEGKQQIIKGNFRSKGQDSIGPAFEEFDAKGNHTGRYQAYVAGKNLGDSHKEVLVICPEETESVTFDKIKKINPIIQDGVVIFVGQTKTADFRADRGSYEQDLNYSDSLVFNNEVVASYPIIEDLKFGTKKAVFKAKQKKEQMVVTVDLERRVQEGKRYESVEGLSDSQGNLIYVAKNDGKMFVVLNGVEQTQHEYDPKSWSQRIAMPGIINGKLAYVLDLENSATVFYDGVEVEKVAKKDSYSGGIRICEAEGQLAYMTEDMQGHKKVVLGAKTIIEDDKLEFINCTKGKLSYRLAGKWYFADGKERTDSD